MKKPVVMLAVLLGLSAAALLGIWVLLQPAQEPAVVKNALLLVDKKAPEVQSIQIRNQFGAYEVWQQDGKYRLGDLPEESIHWAYLQMLLEEAATIEMIEVVAEGLEQPALFGLENPEAEVLIQYTDGASLHLLIGSQEPIGGERYAQVAGEDPIYLIKQNRTIRFLMPLAQYIEFEIVPFTGAPSPFDAVGNVTFTGSAFPEPVVIQAVRQEDGELTRMAASFGAATHLIREPRLHGINLTECLAVFASLSGLLNETVVAYNCTDEELARLGFDQPLIEVRYEYYKEKGGQPFDIVLKVVLQEGSYLAIRDEIPVVHEIRADQAFLSTSYEKMVMRWFLTPFITDVAAVELEIDNVFYRFELAGESNRELSVKCNGLALDMELFRKFYILLISAGHNQEPGTGYTKEGPLMLCRFSYRDSGKEDDLMALYPGGPRRLAVEVNGIGEFLMSDKYLDCVAEAAGKLLAGEDFNTDW